MSVLSVEYSSDPSGIGYAGMNSEQKTAAINSAVVDLPRTLTVGQVVNFFAGEKNGAGAAQRSALDLIREFGVDGTIRGGAIPGTVTGADARRSYARTLNSLFMSGMTDLELDVNDPEIQIMFTSLGPDGGAGADVITTAQILSLAALATTPATRASVLITAEQTAGRATDYTALGWAAGQPVRLADTLNAGG